MTFYVENETEYKPDFDINKTLEAVMNQVLHDENCPYESSVNLLITDDVGIKQFNLDFRNIDKETDVLSFPNLSFTKESDFENAASSEVDCFDPDSGELLLGDIIINKERVISQANTYGHSQKREFAFLVAHSMLHLCGYDHMVPEEEAIMERKQEDTLQKLGITREMGNNSEQERNRE